MNTISPMAFVHPDAKLGDNNEIGPFCYIDADVVIGDNNKLYSNVTIHQGARIGNNNEFFPGASISTKPQDLKYRDEATLCEVGDNNSIRENVTISRGTASRGKTTVGSNNLLMENMHVAHDCVLGSGLIIGNSTKLAGEVEIDDNAIISATVGLMCPTMSFIAALLYYPYYGGFQLLTLLANWLKLVCFNFPFAWFTQVFFIQPLLRTLIRKLFARDIHARAASPEA